MGHESELPPIEDWWAGLTIGARHLILDDPRAPFDERVRDEIARITGVAIPPDAVLSAHEIGFIEIQQQPVD